MSQEHLKVNSLYILLFLRTSPPLLNDFHWALYFHRHPTQGGTKYHIKTEGSGWIADHGDTADILKTFLLVGAFRIADVPVGWEEHLDKTVRRYDDQLNTGIPGVTCRVWVLWVLALLEKDMEGKRVLRCGDLDGLEGEVQCWGNGCAGDADRNVQPRPVGESGLCGL